MTIFIPSALAAALAMNAHAQVAVHPPARAALDPAAPVPAVGRAAQISTYDGGEYRSRWDAQNALEAAEVGLRQAGIAVLGGRVIPPAAGQTRFSLHIDYQDGQAGPDRPSRTIETYTSGEFDQSYRAGQELRASVSNLAAGGYVVLRGQTLPRQGKWVYQVDYVAGPQNPQLQVRLFTSGYYLYAYVPFAQRDMLATMALLQSQGARILAYGVFPVLGTPYWVYQVRYLAP